MRTGRWYAAMTLLSLLFLTACGNNAENTLLAPAAELQSQEQGAPAVTADVATDALNWFNFRRLQAGLNALVRDPVLDRAAKAHANYQRLHNLITHDESPGSPGFTGADPGARLQAAGYADAGAGIADGEVIAAVKAQDGFAVAEALIGAIYHRFVILEPVFSQAGAGESSSTSGYYWLNMNLAGSIGNQSGHTELITWPASGQRNVRTNIFTNLEYPDPLPAQDSAGFPVSVHANREATLQAESFTIRARGESPLAVKLLEHATDTDTPHSAAAIIPLTALRPLTTYDVEFNGRINALPVSRRWWFTTGR